MMDKQKKYTHLIENCNSLVKAYTEIILEKYTGDSLSTAYWRLRDGKGLQTYTDKSNLNTWSSIVTEVRRFFASPASLSMSMHKELHDYRQQKLDEMEAYKDWLANGSTPLYLYEANANTGDKLVVHEVATYYALNEICRLNAFSADMVESQLKDKGLDPNPKSASSKAFVEAFKNALKDFWSNNMDAILKSEFKIYTEILPLWEEAEQIKEQNEKESFSLIFDRLKQNYGYTYVYPTNDRVYHIRTDMDHRSSIGAKLNATLNWIHRIENKSAIHTDIYEADLMVIDEFKRWKFDVKSKKEQGIKPDSEECFHKVIDALDRIKVPAITTDKSDG